MADRPRTNTEIDRELRRRLAGSRLVCEADIEDDLLLDAQKAWIFTQTKKGAFCREYPAICAVYLARWGVDHYKENEFWTDLKLGPEQNRVGEAFEAALPALGLETFPQFREPGEKKARRFVAPILAHGGIPGSLAHGFLSEVLFPAVRRSPGATGAELVARWRREPPPYLRTTVGRFLLHGGKTAVDLVDRLIGLASIPRADLDAGADTGVPHHLVRAYLAVPPALVPAARRALPRPTIELDPWGDEGPVLRLPQLVKEDGDGLVWTIEDGTRVAKEERGYPRRDLTPLPLYAADEWVVTARRNGEVLFDKTYECFGDNQMLCFDDDRSYLPDVEGIKAATAWVVSRKGVTFAALEADGYRPLAGETTGFHGDWSKYQAVRLDLSTVDVLCARENDAEIGRVQVLRVGAGRPRLSEPPLRDVTSKEGLEVRASLPPLVLPSHATWRIRLTGPDGSFSRVETVGDLPATVALAELVPAPSMGRWVVSATQALGFDFQVSFAMVPGLRVETPAEPQPPSAGDVSVTLSTADRSLKFPGRAAGEPYAVTVPADQTHAELWVFSREHLPPVGLLLTIPRIRWAFRGAVVPEMGSRVLTFAPDDLGTAVPALLVTVGRGDVPVRVLLEDAEGERLLLAGAGRTSPDGTYRVDLAGIRDTARACAERGLRLNLIAAETSVLVGYHLPAQHGKRPAGSGEPSVFERDFEVEVMGVGQTSLAVWRDDWAEQTIPQFRLPRPLASYRKGERLTVRVISISQKYVLDARVFDPTAFQLGEVVTGKVSRISGASLLVSARGHELIVDEQRLPVGRPARTWRPGEDIKGKVVSINPLRRKLRMSVAPFEPGSLKPGDLVCGKVFFSGEVIFALVNGCVGHIRSGDRPAAAVRVDDPVDARVLRIDRKRDQIELTCRPFNSGGLAAGDRVMGEITGIRDSDAWVLLPGGETAVVSLTDPLERDYVAGTGVGARIRVVIASIDKVRSRITAQLAEAPGP